MRTMYKSELARLAGVSANTFRRYLNTRRDVLAQMGVAPRAKMLNPKAHGIVSQRQNALCRCRTFVTSIIQDGKLTLPREKIYGPTGEQVCDAEYQYV